MTFLQLCQRVNQIVGFQGRISSVTATGYQEVLVKAVKESYEDIQRYRRDWPWLRGHKEINIGSGVNYYSLEDLWTPSTPDLATWLHINYNFKRLPAYAYDAYELMDFSNFNPQKPTLYTVDPVTAGLHIAPVDAVYTLDAYYIKVLDDLGDNGDTPLLPPRFHEVIVYGACMKLSSFVGNPTLYDTYSVKYAEGMGQLMREENPAKRVRLRPIA